MTATARTCLTGSMIGTRRRLGILVVLAPAGVAASLAVWTMLSAWWLDRAITAARRGMLGTIETWQMHDPPSEASASPYGLPQLLVARGHFPSPRNPGALAALLQEGRWWWLSCSMLCVISAVALAVAGAAIATRRWRRFAPAGEQTLSRGERLSLLDESLRGAAWSLLMLPAIAAIAWYVLTHRQLASSDQVLDALPRGALPYGVVLGALMVLSFCAGRYHGTRWLKAHARGLGRCERCGYRAGDGALCPECGATTSELPEPPTRGPRWRGATAGALLAGAAALLLVTPDSGVRRWLLLRSPPSPAADRSSPIVGACRLNQETVWLQWPDGQAYVVVMWHEGPDGLPMGLRRGTARCATVYFDNSRWDLSPQEAEPRLETWPLSDGELPTVEVAVGPRSLRVRAQLGGPGVGSYFVWAPGATDFCRYPVWGPTTVAWDLARALTEDAASRGGAEAPSRRGETVDQSQR